MNKKEEDIQKKIVESSFKLVGKLYLQKHLLKLIDLLHQYLRLQ